MSDVPETGFRFFVRFSLVVEWGWEKGKIKNSPIFEETHDMKLKTPRY